MRLVECTEDNQPQHPPNIHTYAIKDEEISSPHTLQNLDKEMNAILGDTTTNINQKCLLYHQVLQRYLGFIKRMRHNEQTSLGNALDESGKDPSSCEEFNVYKSRRFSIPEVASRHTSTPKANSSEHVSLLGLPIRVRKRLLRRQKLMQRRKNKRESSLSNDSAVLPETMYEDEDDDDDSDLYEDVLNDDGEAHTTTSNTAVDGWVGSNIEK